MEFEEYLGFPAQHLEEKTKSLNSSHCYKETSIENSLKKSSHLALKLLENIDCSPSQDLQANC